MYILCRAIYLSYITVLPSNAIRVSVVLIKSSTGHEIGSISSALACKAVQGSVLWYKSVIILNSKTVKLLFTAPTKTKITIDHTIG